MPELAPLHRTFGRTVLFWRRSVLIALLALAATSTGSAQVNVLTYHNDNARTGRNLNESILTPTSVNFANFGRIGFLSVDGLVDAEPLYVSNLQIAGVRHNVVFVVTENDSVYAFDVDTFAQLWHVSALPVLSRCALPRDSH